MTEEYVITLGKQALTLTLFLAAPMLISGLFIGLVIGILQAVTQVHEMTITFVPKIVFVLISLMLALPWLMNMIIDFTTQLFQNIPNIIH